MSNGGTPTGTEPPDQQPGGSALLSNIESGVDAYHRDKRLMADLTTLNGQISRYVLRYLDVDAGRAAPVSADEELALGVRMVELGEAVRARAGDR